jgi:hypothetical protein
MPTRKDFPAEYFEGNPLEGADLEEAYRRLQWGNEPRELIDIDAPEPLVALGEAARLELADRVITWDEGEYHLAIGLETNKVYLFPKDLRVIPDSGYESVGEVEQTDYYSDKGAEEGYYYHEHEAPFPECLMHPSGVIVLEPIETEEGRSYAVSDEGIIG